MAPKIGTSQNPSTSEVPGEFLGYSFNDNRKNIIGGTIHKQADASHIMPLSIVASSTQVSTEMEEKEKVPWEPPCIRTMHLEREERQL